MMDADLGSFIVTEIKKPFEVNDDGIFKVEDVFSKEFFKELKTGISSIELNEVSSDLSHFNQSADLKDLKAGLPVISKFLNILNTTVKNKVEEVFEVRPAEKITLTVSKYKKGDFLLCHDDKFDTRIVAFVFYCNDLSPEDGGSLRFYSHDEDCHPTPECYEKTILPQENSLILFKVTKMSHHDVEQMFNNNERVSINGWFHRKDGEEDPEADMPREIFSKAPFVPLIMKMFNDKPIREIVSSQLLSERNITDMSSYLRRTKDVALVVNNVLDESFYQECVLELEDCYDFHWRSQGPANHRMYETLDFEVEGPHISLGESFLHINNLIDYLLSPDFLEKLGKIAGVCFAVFEGSGICPTSILEIQRWKEGSYSLLSDNQVEKEFPVVEVTVFFRVNENKIGSASSISELSGVMVLTLEPPMMSKSDYKKLYRIKRSRMIEDIGRASKEMNKKLRIKSLQENVNAVIREKMKMLMRYRKSANLSELKVFEPKNNSMIISYGSSNVSKYTSYIRKTQRDAQDVCFYAVNVTYFTA